MPPAPAFALLTAVALAVLLAAERSGRARVKWVAKPLASAGFLGVAFAVGGWQGDYGRLVLLALAFCWLGDVLLIPRGARAAFAVGLASFLLGHLVFAAAFLGRGLDPAAALAAAAALAVFAFTVLRWLRPHVPDALRLPVHAYVVVISAMVVTAAAAGAAGAGLAVLVGAVLFAVSDLAVARERFVARSFANGAWGLPLYYAATLLLASTAGAA